MWLANGLHHEKRALQPEDGLACRSIPPRTLPRNSSEIDPLIAMTTMHRVTVFVDWDTARRVVPCRSPNVRHIEDVFDRLQLAISRHIHRRDRHGGYRINWRIYHGWHQGKTKTKDRMLFDKYVTVATARSIDRVSFSSDYSFSGELSCTSRRSPVFDTLRFDRNTGETKQKMVDTMLVCDLLHHVKTKDSALLILIADDDDFAPALFTAEAWNASIMMLHNRESTNSALNLVGIAEKMGFQ